MSDGTPVPVAIDEENPWLGLASFTEETRAFFHGRDDDVAELGRRVQRKQLTILFGQSGHGKTSLLRAGLVPRLRPEGYCPVYVRIDYAPESASPAEQIKAAIFRATAAAGKWTKTGSSLPGETLWEFLHHRDDILEDAAGRPLIPLLIFDQFEEIFTLAQADSAGRERAHAFLTELADLVENRPPAELERKIDRDEIDAAVFDFARADYRILISLREDYLAALESLKASMPSVTQNRVRLARFNGAQALAAVRQPAPSLVSDDVATQIVRYISGGTDLTRAEVEPSLLSLVCRELNNARLARRQATITADLLAGSRDTILQEFYERALADQPPGVRRFIEDELLTDSGYRENVAEERVQKGLAAAGAAPDALSILVGRRLLRIEDRLDLRRVELTHDVLTGVVASSRSLRREREAKEAAEQQLATTREKEAGTQRALWRARLVASLCAVLAAGALASAVFGYISLRRARSAETEANRSAMEARDAAAKREATEEMAQDARTEAEKIVTYLLDDFYNELEPIGQLGVVGDLAKRAVDYYRALPVTLRSPTTVRNQALALTRYGSVLVAQGKHDDAGVLLDEAIRLFQRLQDNGDHTDDLRVGLSIALRNQARMFHSLARLNEALTSAQQAVDTLQSFETQTSAPNAIRREVAQNLNRLGFEQLRTGQEEKSIGTLQRCRAVYEALGARDMSDPRLAALYADTSAWLIEAEGVSGRPEDATAVAKDALAITKKALEVDPGSRRALRAETLILRSLANGYTDRLQPDRALEFSQQSIAAEQLLHRLDPTDAVNRGNLRVAELAAGWTLVTTGRLRDGLRALDDQLAKLEPADLSYINTLEDLEPRGEAALAAQLGDHQRAMAYLAKAHEMDDRRRKLVGPESGLHDKLLQVSLADPESAVALAEGDYIKAADLARQALARLSTETGHTIGETQDLAYTVRPLDQRLASAELRLGHFEAAATAARGVINSWALRPPLTVGDRRDLANAKTTLALALARDSKLPEALSTIEPVLKLEREFGQLGTDPQQQTELALAIYTKAVSLAPAETAARSELLREAAEILGKLPAEPQELQTVKELVTWIAQAGGGVARP